MKIDLFIFIHILIKICSAYKDNNIPVFSKVDLLYFSSLKTEHDFFKMIKLNKNNHYCGEVYILSSVFGFKYNNHHVFEFIR